MITRAITSLFLPENITYLNVCKWNSEHGNANLANSVLNISSEISRNEVKNDTFKGIVSCDPITINPKYETPIEVKLFAKHVFTANDLPNISIDMATLRRLIFVKSIKSVQLSKQSPLFEVEYSKHKNEWLAIMLQGVFKLANREFRLPKGDISVIDDFIDANEPTFQFIRDCFDIGDKEKFVSGKKIKKMFDDYILRNHLERTVRPLKQTTLTKKINNLISSKEWDVKYDRKRVNGIQERGWFGLFPE